MKPPQLFTDLLHAWHQDSSSDAVDALAANLAATLGAAKHPVCLVLLKTSALPRVYGLAVFLGGYGIVLRHKHRGRRDGCYVYAEIVLSAKGDFEGAVIREKPKPTQDAEQEGAA